ncbi:MAG: nitronate monooxygenase, partial [Chloroflexi bacterium]|nr:nitronate monooxygenase [Chloroflexota bacterium]
DAVIVTGYEGGGHGGTDQLTTLVLVPQVVDAVKIPVIAGGGVADARGAAAVLALGAEGVYVGTAFMATNECDAHPRLKEAIVKAGDASTITWIGPLGTVRALKNEFSAEILKMKSEGRPDKELGRFAYGADKFRPALIEGNIDQFFVPLGAAAGLVREVVAAGELVRRIAKGVSASTAGH